MQNLLVSVVHGKCYLIIQNPNRHHRQDTKLPFYKKKMPTYKCGGYTQRLFSVKYLFRKTNTECLEFSMNRCRCLLYRRKIAIPTVLWQENDFQYWFHCSFNSILIESTNCWNVNSETSVRDFRVTFTANGQIQVENFSKYKLKENEQNWNLIV